MPTAPRRSATARSARSRLDEQPRRMVSNRSHRKARMMKRAPTLTATIALAVVALVVGMAPMSGGAATLQDRDCQTGFVLDSHMITRLVSDVPSEGQAKYRLSCAEILKKLQL